MAVDLIPVKFGPRVAEDLPRILRDLADAAERGEITGMVYAFQTDAGFVTNQSASLRDALVLCDLLHANTLDLFRA